jgi:hypothetical protein
MEDIQEYVEKARLNSSFVNDWWDASNNSVLNNGKQDLKIDKIAKRYVDIDNSSTVPRNNSENSKNLYPLKNKEQVLPHLRKIKKNYNTYDIYQQSVQKWKCIVTGISKKTFRAKLEDLDEEVNTTYEVAEFDFEEISPSDLTLLSLGAVFYWSIGYEMKNGQLTKRSSIRFQRLVPWNESEYDTALEKAECFLTKIAWD